MDQDLISKKELLKLTDISYGQLYRWKRKNLIPEEWFIRKSAFTGQETFFPKHKILKRIDQILNRSNDLSLDELADMLSPNPKDITLSKDELLLRNIVSNETLDLYMKFQPELTIFTFDKIVQLYILEKLLLTGSINLAEGTNLLQTLNEHYEKVDGKTSELIFVRKMGVSLFLLVEKPNAIHFEQNVKIINSINIASCIAELKSRLM